MHAWPAKTSIDDHHHTFRTFSCSSKNIKHFRQPWFGGWGYNLSRGEECAAKWREIPQDTDILITHGPPIGHGDKCRGGIRAGWVVSSLFLVFKFLLLSFLLKFRNSHDSKNFKRIFSVVLTCCERYSYVLNQNITYLDTSMKV